MANVFQVLVNNLNQLGFYGFILPWLFTFAVVFGLLLQTKAFAGDKKIMGVVALVIAFFVTGFGAVPLSGVLTTLFGNAILILAGILVIVLFAGMTGFKLEDFTSHKEIIWIFVGIGVIIFFSVGAAALMNIRLSSDVVAAIFVVIFMAVAIYFIGMGSSNSK